MMLPRGTDLADLIASRHVNGDEPRPCSLKIDDDSDNAPSDTLGAPNH
jgi:hypothetical protein